MARSKVKSRSHHDTHLHPLTNVPIKYQLPTPYGFRDIARTRFYRSRSLRQGQRWNQNQTLTLHTYTSKPMSLLSINLLHLTVSEIQPGQDFLTQGQYGKVKGPIKVRPWCCTPSPNQCPYQVSTSCTLRFLRYNPDKLFPAARPLWVKSIPRQPLRVVG